MAVGAPARPSFPSEVPLYKNRKIHNSGTNLSKEVEAQLFKDDVIIIKPLGIVINPRVILFELKQGRHPYLFKHLRQYRSLGPNRGIKLVPVLYDANFSRIIRHRKPESWVKEAGSPRKDKSETSKSNRGPGRPKIQFAYLSYGKRGSDECKGCGRHFGIKKGKLEHLKHNRCVVVQLQMNRDRCYFCIEPIDPSSDPKTIEASEHIRNCIPLCELKTLIQQEHLQDSGLRPEEVEAFNFLGQQLAWLPARITTKNDSSTKKKAATRRVNWAIQNSK